MKISVTLLIVVLMFASTNAQNIITGRVIDSKTGKPMEGVNIYVTNNQTGTLSGGDGSYVLNKLPKSGMVNIQFSFIGYKSVLKNISLDNNSQILDVAMQPTVLRSEEIVISGGRYSTQHENAVTIESISPKQITESGSFSMMEALTSRPGLDLIAKSPGVSKPVIRGLSMTNILVLNNGVKLENFQFAQDHPFIINEYGIDKVEVIKGPASLLYGSGAVGGIINFVKEKPATYNTISGDFHQHFYSNTEGFLTNIGIKGNHKNFLWGIRSGIKSHKDFTDGNGNVVTNSRFNKTSTKANLGIIRPFGTFKLFYDYNQEELGMTVPPVLSLITDNSRKNKFWYQNLSNHLLASQNKLFLGNQQLDINIAYQNNHRQLITTGSKENVAVDLTLQTISYDIKTIFANARNNTLITGIQGNYQKNTNGNAPEYIIPDAFVNNIGFIGLFQSKVAQKINTQVGIRYDILKINIPIQNYNTINSYDSSIIFPIENIYQNISFSTGITYHINDIWLLRLNLASAFRPPNLAELTQNGLHGTRYEIGNPDMISQRNYESDFAIHFHSNNFALDVSPFYNRINNYIFLSPSNDFTLEGYRIYRYDQTNATIYGGEVSGNYATTYLKTGFSYSYLVGKQEDNSWLPFIPQNKLRGNIRLLAKKFWVFTNPFLQTSTVLALSQNHPSIFETPTEKYNIWNISAGSSFNAAKTKFNWVLTINNLLNTTYYDHLSTLKDSGFYNMGRNISIAISINF